MKKNISKMVVLLLLSCLIFTANCKKKDEYNIPGTWNLTMVGESDTFTTGIVFTGSEVYGNFRFLDDTAAAVYPDGGMYTVAERDVTFSATGILLTGSGEIVINFRGSFVDEDTLTGTGEEETPFGDAAFTWTAAR